MAGRAINLIQLPPDGLAGTLLSTIFFAAKPPEDIDAFAVSMRAFRPTGVWGHGAGACRRPARRLSHITAPTLLGSNAANWSQAAATSPAAPVQ